MVQVTIGGVGELQCPEANVIESLVVNTVCFISVFNQLMNRKGGVVRFNDSIGNFGRRHNRIGVHDSVGVFFTNLGNEKGTHSRSSTTTKGVGKLESLEAIARFCFFPHHIKDRVDKLGTCKSDNVPILFCYKLRPCLVRCL